MSLIRWQPQSGWDCLSKRMVRLVRSARRLPRGPPRGWSMSPAGPSFSNRLLQAKSVCRLMPTMAAKSLAGSPLRFQVSRSKSRCSGVSGGVGPCGFCNDRGPPRRRPLRGGRQGGAASSGADSSAGGGGKSPEDSSAVGPWAAGPGMAAAGSGTGPVAAASGCGTPLGLRPRSVPQPGSALRSSNITPSLPVDLSTTRGGNYSAYLLSKSGKDFGEVDSHRHIVLVGCLRLAVYGVLGVGDVATTVKSYRGGMV